MSHRQSWIGSDLRKQHRAIKVLQAAVNIVDMPVEDENPPAAKQLDITEEFPVGDGTNKMDQGPELIEYGRTRSFDSAREAEYGQGLNDLATDRWQVIPQAQPKSEPSRANEAYHDDNQWEDTDIHLGEDKSSESITKEINSINQPVYPPYSTSTSEPDSRYENIDQTIHNVTTHAQMCNAEAGAGVCGTHVRGSDEKSKQLSGHSIEVKDVNGADVRDNKVTDFALGGNHEAYPNDIPKDEIWLEDHLEQKPKDRAPLKVHEVTEDIVMEDLGLDYDPAHEIADEVEEVVRKKADDPVKAQTDYHGIKIDIEWPKGSLRSYEGNDTYVTHMKCNYGYARGVKGTDNDQLDIYLGDKDSDTAYIVEQMKDDGSYDEDKVMLGFDSVDEAQEMYLAHMPLFMLGNIREVPVDKLVNALYGQPEDRRGKEDLVPSEETVSDKESSVWPSDAQDVNEWTNPDETRDNRDISRDPATEQMKYRAWMKKWAAYSDLAIKVLKQQNDPNVQQLLSTKVRLNQPYAQVVDELTRAMITDEAYKTQLEDLVGKIEEPQRQDMPTDQVLDKETTQETNDPNLRYTPDETSDTGAFDPNTLEPVDLSKVQAPGPETQMPGAPLPYAPGGTRILPPQQPPSSNVKPPDGQIKPKVV